MRKIFSYILAFLFLVFVPVIYFWWKKEGKREEKETRTFHENILDTLKDKFDEELEIPDKDKFFFEYVQQVDSDVAYKAIRWKIYRMFTKYYFLTMPKFIEEEWFNSAKS